MQKLKILQFIETILLVVIVVLPIRFFLFEPFFVIGESMEPNYHSFDYLIIDKISYRLRDPQRGDVVIFRPPNNPSVFYIKRIIGLPNERVVIQDGQIYIYNEQYPNGFLLEEPYLIGNIETPGNYDVKVEQDSYFVLGDNRDQSYDSRRWGFLPRKDIAGRVAFNLKPVSAFFRLIRASLAR
jgi:signal peptidase I